MIHPSKTRFLLLLPALAIAVAACSGASSGEIPCADDSSCPNDFPVCQAGFCRSGTQPQDSAASVSVVGVDGKAAGQPVRGAVTVSVTAKASSGVKQLTLTPTGKSAIAPTSSAAGVYKFPLDTTQLTDGNVDLTARLEPGNPSVAAVTAVFTLHVDNTPPVLTAAATIPPAQLGTLVTLDVTASEPVQAIDAEVLFSGDVIGLAAEVAPPTGNVHHLGFPVVSSAVPGTYTFRVTATDIAGNSTAASLDKSFDVPAAPTASVTADKTTVSAGDQVVLTVHLTNGSGILTANPAPNPAGPVTDGATFNVTPGASTTYTLMVTNAAGAQVSSFVVVSVNAVPTATLTGTATINPGQSAALTATVSNATSARIEPGGTPVAADGAPHIITVTPSVTTPFSLVAVNASGAVTTAGPVTVTVNRPFISSFTGPAFYTDGKSGFFNLVAAFGGGTGASAAVSTSDGSLCTTGTPTTPPATFLCGVPTSHVSVTYTLTVTLGTGANSVATATLTVQVAGDPANSTIGISSIVGANPINPGSLTFLGGNFCFGCTATINPGIGTLPPFSSPYLVSTGPLQTTTVFTLSVTNQAGDTATKTTTVTVNRPTITSFTGPSSFTAGKANLPLAAVFGGGPGASASVVATTGTTTSTCTPAASTTSPQSFSCTAITQDTTYRLTVTLGTGANSTATSDVTVKVAPTQSATAGPMPARFGASLALLPNGNVLIAGGSTAAPPTVTSVVDTAQIFDPSTGTFTLAGQGASCAGTPANQHMSSKRYQGTATLLGSGLVLLAGGTSDGTAPNAVDTADLYDPAADCFAATGALKAKRFGHTATRLVSGKILVAGGTDTTGSALSSAELFDGATFTTIAGGTHPILNAARTQATATLLNSGKVLIAGGSGAANADLYDPTTNAGNGSFSSATLQDTRSQHTATLLGNGTVLLAGGAGTPPLNTAEIYDPVLNTSTATGTLQTGRALHTATLLPAGTVLIAAGTTATGATSSTELFDPAGTFSNSAPLSVARTQHGAVFLFSGSALVVGGVSNAAAGDLLTP